MSALTFSSMVILFVLAIGGAAAYGDYTQEGKLPWRKKKDDGVNSGAKFGQVLLKKKPADAYGIQRKKDKWRFDMKLIFERVGNIVYAREFGSHPLTRKVYKILEEKPVQPL